MKKVIVSLLVLCMMIFAMSSVFAANAPSDNDLRTAPIISKLEIHNDNEGYVWIEVTVQTPANVKNAIDYFENHELGYNQAGYIDNIMLQYSIDGGEWEETSLGYSPNYDQNDDNWNGIFETEYLSELHVDSNVKARAYFSGATADGTPRVSDFSNELVLNEKADFQASTWAQMDKKKLVTKEYIDIALKERIERVKKYDSKYMEMIKDNTLLMDTEGSHIGQINGLTVMTIGDYTFGKPVKITANTYSRKNRSCKHRKRS